MSFTLVLAFLFFVGSLIGWLIELVFRRFFAIENTEKKWVNPGFLSGPYLPLYGFSLCVLFLLAHIKIPFITNPVIQQATLFLIMAACITIIEYIAGLIFIKGMKIKLWDYSNRKGNIQGIICPTFSFFWIILSAVYYFLVHPRILNWLFWFTNNLSFSFFVGLFYGVFLIDVCYSFNVSARIKKFADEKKIIVRYELLREHIRQQNEEFKEKRHFIFSMTSKTHSLTENLLKYFEKEQEKLKNEITKLIKKD